MKLRCVVRFMMAMMIAGRVPPPPPPPPPPPVNVIRALCALCFKQEISGDRKRDVTC
jgi:hypothetical protein